ncbi:MAG: hypothetical protein ACK5MJ_01240 [Alphaproteobacteria bacterium]
MKTAFFIASALIINSLNANAESDVALSTSLSQYDAVTIDINTIRRDSNLLRKMYDDANKLSENLQNIIEKLQEDSVKRWSDINEQAQKDSLSEREDKIQQNQLIVDANERFIVSRRIAIENAVSRVDAQIRDELTNRIIPEYAQKNHINVIFRNTQVIYSQLPDITGEILNLLNESTLQADLGLETLIYEDVIAEINQQVASNDSSISPPSVVSPK